MATDNLGRDTGGDLPVNSLVRGLSSNVTEVMEENDTQSGHKLDSLLQATKGVADAVGDNIGQSIRSAKEYSDQIIQTHQKIFTKDTRQESRQSREQAATAKTTTDLVRKIYNMGKTPRTFWVGVGTFHANALYSLKKVLADCGLCRGGSRAAEAVQRAMTNRQAGSAGGVGGMGGRGGGGGAGEFGEVMEDASGGFLFSANKLSGAATFLVAATSRLSKAFEVDFSKTIAGSMSESNAFRMQIREYLYQTRDMTKSNRGLAESYYVLAHEADAMGVYKGTADKLWMSNLQRGFSMEKGLAEEGLSYNKIMDKRLRATKMTMRVGVHAAKQLGMNVESMNSTFMDWRMHLGMGVHEITRMSNAMMAVSKSTGVVGTELEKAVAASAEIMKNMKTAGTLSASSAKSVLSMMTAAQKYGVGDQVGQMMTALTGGLNSFQDASSEMQSILIQSAALTGDQELVTNVRFGQAGDPAELAKLSGGFETLIKRVGLLDDKFAQDLGFEKLDLTNLSGLIQELKDEGRTAEAGALQGRLKAATGFDVGTIENIMKSLQEGGRANRTYAERMEEINQKMKEMEIQGLEETGAYKDLEKSLRQINTQKLQDGFNQYAKVLEERGHAGAQAVTEELIEELSKTMGPKAAKEFAANISGQANEFLKDLSTRADIAGKDLGGLLSEQGLTERKLRDMLASGDESQVANAMNVLNDVSMQIQTKDKASQDPIENLQDIIREINGAIRDKLDKLLAWLPDWSYYITVVLGELGPIALAIGGVIASLGFVSRLLGGGGLLGGLGGAAGGGGLGGAAGGAVTAWGASKLNPRNWFRRGTPAPGQFTSMDGAMGRQARRSTTRTTGQRIADVNARRARSGRSPIQFRGYRPEVGAVRPGAPRVPTSTAGSTRSLSRARGGSRFMKILGLAALGDQMLNKGRLTASVTGIDLQGANKQGPVVGDMDDCFCVYVMNWPEGFVAGASGPGGPGTMPAAPPQPQEPPPTSGVEMAFMGMYGYSMLKNAKEGMALSKQGVQLSQQANTLQKANGARQAAQTGKVAQGLNSLKEGMKTSKIGQGVSKTKDIVKGVSDSIKGSKPVQALGTAKNMAASPFRWMGEKLGAAKGATTGALGKIPGVAQIGTFLQGSSKAAGILRGAGAIAKKIPLLDVALGGVFGALDAEKNNMSAGTGAAFGVLTGGSGTGTEDKFFSGMASKALGIEQGSNADEMVGAYGSMGRGALIGASVGGPVGAAIGAGVGGAAEIGKVLHGAHAEVAQMTERMESFNKAQDKFNAQSLADTQAITDAQERLKELERKKFGKENLLGGQKRNLRSAQKDLDSRWSWGGANPAWRAARDTVKSDKRRVAQTEEALAALAAEIKKTKSEIAAQEKMALERAQQAEAKKAEFAEMASTEMTNKKEEPLLSAMPLQEEASQTLGNIDTNMDITSKTMLMGQMPGSIYTHDTHSESKLNILAELLRMSLQTLLKIEKCVCSYIAMGAFDDEMPRQAIDTGIQEKYEQAMGEAGQIPTADRQLSKIENTVNRLISASQTKEMYDKKTTMAEAGKGLYYELDNKPMLNETYDKVQSIISEQAALAKEEAKRGYEAAAGNGLDYREQIKGQVSAVASTIAEAERRVAQEKASAESEGNSTAMGMSGVESILQEEVALMQMMHEVLVAIKDNTSRKAGSAIIGPRGSSLPPRAAGVKSIARDYVRGNWDLNGHDMSPASVQTDGRGGY